MSISEWLQDSQKKTLAVIGVVLAALLALYLLGVRPLQAGRRAARQATSELDSKIRNAESLEDVSERLINTRNAQLLRLSTDLERYLPPSSQTVAWATTTLTQLAGEAGLQLISVNPVKYGSAPWERSRTGRLPTRGNKDKPAPKRIKRVLAPYAVNLLLHGGYDELRTFLDRLRRDNPYASPLSLSIRPRQGYPESHTIRLQVIWPMVTRDDADKVQQIITTLEKTTETIPLEEEP